jgi:uncharacterized protein YdeI (YjbR/CyaY-like superfamily)
MAIKLSSGTVHQVPADLRKTLTSAPKMRAAWEDITPLARNEWICWITSVKTEETRKDHLRRAREDLEHGKRRPCCWAGCMHRKDKALSPSQKWVLSRRSKK